MLRSAHVVLPWTTVRRPLLGSGHLSIMVAMTGILGTASGPLSIPEIPLYGVCQRANPASLVMVHPNYFLLPTFPMNLLLA